MASGGGLCANVQLDGVPLCGTSDTRAFHPSTRRPAISRRTGVNRWVSELKCRL
ncbi:hypothetical protein BDZ89DRAFT_1076454 [Hymenopellis radicata]|nr:hypothetical protein BDZ89DRAFT_1076454 [Hymenopellis radicata]